ncbi:hypothetical protein SLEP1_g33149 [Rubroshorea leprosula]|uniref:Uncharacterized protein n=1 Tax=Rubroshorea leprosula TaxID=152421 RepID=A0AAV5KFP6_9ROSI|nr:hypothetical protein SLEP1_g33149 [Rubroshorea leprosula]
MAAKSSEEEKAYFPGVMDGTKNSTVNFSCFELIKPSFDKTKDYCSLDVLPILIDEAPFPVREKCNFNGSHGQDDCSIPVLPEEGNVSPQHTSPLTFLSFLGFRLSSKNQMCLASQLNCQNCIDSQMQNEDAYSPSILNVNVEKESSEILKSNDEMVGSTKGEGVMTVSTACLSHYVAVNYLSPLFFFIFSFLLKKLFWYSDICTREGL